MEQVMESELPSKKLQEPTVEYIIVEEEASTSVDAIFNMLFEQVDKTMSKK